MCRACLDRLATHLKPAARRPHIYLARGFIRAYRLTFSAIMGRSCRYLPTCSEFTEEAIVRHGLWYGGWIGFYRIASCHPWGGSGYDPVPEHLPDNARWWAVWRLSRRHTVGTGREP